jgi:hypothetical protein
LGNCISIINTSEKYRIDDDILSKSLHIGRVPKPVDFEILNSVYDTISDYEVEIDYGKVIKVYDNGTFTIAAKLNYIDSKIYRFTIHIRDVEIPESSVSSEEYGYIEKAKNVLHDKIFGKIVYLKNISTEEYGRIYADIWLDELYIKDWLNQEIRKIYEK